MPNRLSVRATAPGLRKAIDVEVDGSPNDRTAAQQTILIHGYQNTKERAEQSYRDFEAAVRHGPMRLRALGALWHFHWPSDHPRKLISVATYAARVAEADEAGRLLATGYLATLSRGQEVNLIAHSLGCRVALRTAQSVEESDSGWPGARITTVVLLAAAVPQLHCTAAPYPFPRPQHGLQHVFHSRRDRALGLAFDLGQYVYGEAGDAVGRDGRPDARWSSRTDSRLRHSKYWGSRRVSRQASELIARGKARPHIGLRTLPRSTLPESLPDVRVLRRRRPPRRQGW